MQTVQHEPVSRSSRARVTPYRATSEARARNSAAASLSPRAAARRAEPLRGGPWHLAKNVSAYLDPGTDQREARRHVRHAQRHLLWRESSLARVRKCGRVTHGGDGGNVRAKVRQDVAHFSGLQSCGSVWVCPCCGPKIRNGRAEEISAAAARWDEAGNTVVMITYTAPHDFGMRLASLLPVIADGFRSVIRGRPWRRLRDQLGIAGMIRSMEITHGASGWHPHLHCLAFIRGDPGAEGLAQLAAYMRPRWAKWVTGQGYRLPHEIHGVDLQVCTSAREAGLYMAKNQDGRSTGNEMARADLKQGRDGSRTPFELLDDFRWTGDVEDLALWHEYETATKGHQCITWSKGLREIIAAETGWQDDEVSDDDLAAEEIGGEDIAIIPGEVWSGIVKIPGLDAALLGACERSGLAGMNKLLARHGLGPCLPPGSG